MANKIIESLKGISPKMWLIMGGGMVVLIFISRAGKGGQVAAIPSGGDSSAVRDAVNGLQGAISDSNANLSDAIAKQAESFQQQLELQKDTNNKLMAGLSDTYSKSMDALKGDLNNLSHVVANQPNYSTKFTEYDTILAGILDKLNHPVAPTTNASGYYSAGGTYQNQSSMYDGNNNQFESVISNPTKLNNNDTYTVYPSTVVESPRSISGSSGNTYSAPVNIAAQSDPDNQKKYLDNLVAGGGGNAEWAKAEIAAGRY